MKIKKYKSEIKFATIYSIFLNLFVYIGIIFSSEINEMVLFSMTLLIATIITFGLIVFEKKILKKYKLKPLSYNVLLVLSMLLFGLIIAIITCEMVDEGLILPCRDIMCMNGLELIVAYIFIIYLMFGYTMIRTFIYLRSKRKKMQWFILIILLIYIFNNIYNKFNTIKELSFMKVLFYYIFL